MRDAGLIENGAVAVKDGQIAGVGKSLEILNEFQSENVINAGGKVVSPGVCRMSYARRFCRKSAG